MQEIKVRSRTQETGKGSMPCFTRVLLATDFCAASQAAFQTALTTCASLGSTLLILHVFEYANAIPPEGGGQMLEMQSFYDRCCVCLEQLRHQATEAGVQCETLMDTGIPSATILEAISAKEIDLAILGTNALHGFERLVFGSTAEAVLRKAPCPVLTVGPRVQDAGRTSPVDSPVVFATDFHSSTIDAIRYAASFCRLSESPLHCLHVLPRTLETCARSQIIPQIMNEALRQVAVDSGVAIMPSTWATTYGSEISNAVVDYAKQQHARLIVLGVRKASMLASHGPAHIAYRVITEATCPVLTVAFGQSRAALSAA